MCTALFVFVLCLPENAPLGWVTATIMILVHERKFLGNDCKGVLGPQTLGFCARPSLFFLGGLPQVLSLVTSLW